MAGRVGSIILLMATALLAGCAEDVPLASRTTVAELTQGWNILGTDGRAACADGSDYRFFVRPGDPERLLLFLQGGGACWNAESCRPGENSTSVPQIIPAHYPERQSGILDLDHPENPFADYTMVTLPYCTADVHLGDRDASYDGSPGDGGPPFTIRHRGLANTRAVLDWTYLNFPTPIQVVIAGSSAGGVATPFYADRVARHYRRARVIGLGDAAGGFRSDSLKTVEEERWGWPEALRRHDGWGEFGGSRVGTELLYITASRETPNLELYQFDQAHDREQRFFLQLAGSDVTDLHQLIRTNRSDIQQAAAGFRAFTAGGSEHTILNRRGFYYYESDGHRFRDWVAAILSGDTVSSVECDECTRPAYQYTDEDLRVIDRALELLAHEDQWDNRDRQERCDPESTRRTLRCAVFVAAREVRDVRLPPHGVYPAVYDVINTAQERLGDDVIPRPLVSFNNREETTLDDVRGLLAEVRNRVRADLVQ